MRVFIDFEASSLSDNSYPIEVGWVFEDGREEDHLIRPAEGWTDWSAKAETIHGIPRASLVAEGEPHDAVARRMIDALSGHDLLASAPSWDGKWLSVLLRAAGLPRHALRLHSSKLALEEQAARLLPDDVAKAERSTRSQALLKVIASDMGNPAHRALADARAELDRWLAVTERVRDHESRDAERP